MIIRDVKALLRVLLKWPFWEPASSQRGRESGCDWSEAVQWTRIMGSYWWIISAALPLVTINTQIRSAGNVQG